MQAQRKDRGPSLPAPIQANAAFRTLFKAVIEKSGRSTVRILVDGKDAALGTVVSGDGYIVSKASEIKGGPISIKTRDGRDFDGTVVASSETFDLVMIKVDGTGLMPIDWSSSKDALVGNWVAVPAIGPEPVAVGVISTGKWSPKTGFLGVQLEQGVAEARIGSIVSGSAAEKAGLKAKDVIIRVNSQEVHTGDALIETLQGYQQNDQVTVTFMRDGKQMEFKVVLGKRPADPPAPKGKGGNRGDFQNSMGSVLSDRRTGFPEFLQTDAVIKPTDCGGPLVDLDGRAVGLTICRAGRTESWALPAESVKSLTTILMSARQGLSPKQRVAAARAALKAAEDAKECYEVIAEGKRFLTAAETEEAWWHDRILEKGPAPRVVEIERGPTPRTVSK
jgi:serine protease Do